MADLQQTIGVVIRRARRARGMTLKRLAEQAIVSVVYLGEIERGKKYPSPIVLERVAGALEIGVPDLLERVAWELRGEMQPTLRAVGTIGFAPPEARASVTTPGRILSLVGSVA